MYILVQLHRNFGYKKTRDINAIETIQIVAKPLPGTNQISERGYILMADGRFINAEGDMVTAH
jgi:hypothetical protein